MHTVVPVARTRYFRSIQPAACLGFHRFIAPLGAVLLSLFPPRTADAQTVNAGTDVGICAGGPITLGGSPTASPISRCAIAKRVTESIKHKTSLPCERKYSATAIVV